ncbi:hypothetical protein GCM10027046_07740 [Uliginosibacterium flavum]|uniref:Lipoprotein n=1 Tax=Uliginosibacterium flavum TaxID=1396831 RepID=A0ABV2TMS9_9RHOO
MNTRAGLMIALCAALLCSGCDKLFSDAAPDINSPEFKKAAQERQALIKKDNQIVEKAAWFGKTGLSAELERELPRNLRHQSGQTISDKNSLKAADLDYIGAFKEDGGIVRYWRINDGASEVRYAFVTAAPDGGTVMGMGYRQPSGSAQ